MNIFEIYREKLLNILKDLKTKKVIILPESLNSINVDIPPAKFDGDISSNVAMILSKPNQKPPDVIAKIILKELEKIDEI